MKRTTRTAAYLGVLTLAATGWTAGAASAAPASSAPAAQSAHSQVRDTTISAARQSAALRFWTPGRLRAAKDVTAPSASAGAAAGRVPDAAGPFVAVPPVAAAGRPPRGRPRPRCPRPPPGPAAA